jgi:MFS transporter, UMF1 family
MSTVEAATGAGQTVVLEARDTGERVPALSVGSWALYDFANTIYSLNIVSVFFPALILELGQVDAVYAFPMSGALLVVALLMPLLGAMSDRAQRRMPYLIGFTLVSVAMTALMGLVSDLWMLVAAFVVANICYQISLVFYDALLPSVSNTLNWGKISGLGTGLGYVGALFGSIAVTAWIGDVTRPDVSNQDAFLPTALLFLIFSIPCFLFVRERRAASVAHVGAAPRGFRQLVLTLRDAAKVPGLLVFLAANFFYSDALNTVIVAMGVFATQVMGFSSATAVLAPAIVAAVFGSWLFGLVTDRITSKWSLVISLLMWVGVFASLIFIRNPEIFRWVIAPVAGVALGSTWTAARTMIVELSPPARLGEFLGVYNLTGKFSAVLGPALWGSTLLLLDPRVHGYFAYQVGMATLLVMVLIGLALHLRTPNIKRVAG